PDDAGEIARAAVADGYRRVAAEQHQRHRLPDRVAAADDDGVRTGDFHAGVFQHPQHAEWRARPEADTGLVDAPGEQRAGRQQVEAIDVLADGDGLDDARRIDVRRERHLDEDAVARRAG